MRADIPIGLQLLFGAVSYDVVEEDCTGGLVIEVSDNSDKVHAVVVLLRDCQQRCIPNLDEGRLDVYEHMVEVLLVLELFITDDS